MAVTVRIERGAGVEQFPLLFDFSDIVTGNGFIAGVQIKGRALFVRDEDPEDVDQPKWWLYGVEPGGLAEHGSTDTEAYYAFREAFRLILRDMAEQANGYEDFRVEVDRFFRDTSDTDRWDEARAQLKAGTTKPTGTLAEMRRLPSFEERSVQVTELEPAKQTPTSTKPDRKALADAA